MSTTVSEFLKGEVMKHRILLTLFSVLLVVGFISPTVCLAAGEDPTLRVNVAENNQGELSALFQVLRFEPDLREGAGRLRVNGETSFRAQIVDDGGRLQSVYARERWQVEDSPRLARKIFCDNSGGRLDVAVIDRNDRSRHFTFSIGETIIKGADSHRRLLNRLCTGHQQETSDSTANYRQIPGVKEINDIDKFLNTCPPRRELEVLRNDFAVVYQPKYRTPEPTYSCSKDGTRTLEPNPTLTHYQALRVIRHMNLTKPLPWTNLHPYNWLKSKIGGIIVSYEASKPTCCHSLTFPGADKTVTAIKTPKADKPLVESRMSWYDSQSGVGLWNHIALIFHEARHVDLSHNCGPDGNKDSSLEYMGAWAVQYYLAKMMDNGAIQVGLKDKGDYHSALEYSYEEWLSKRFCKDY